MTDSRSWIDLVMAINRESPALRVASRNVALSIRCQRSATWKALAVNSLSPHCKGGAVSAASRTLLR